MTQDQGVVRIAAQMIAQMDFEELRQFVGLCPEVAREHSTEVKNRLAIFSHSPPLESRRRWHNEIHHLEKKSLKCLMTSQIRINQLHPYALAHPSVITLADATFSGFLMEFRTPLPPRSVK